MFSVEVSVYTDKGDLRAENQDRILYKSAEIDEHFVSMFIVADGCGGLEHGEIASAMVISHFEHFWSRIINGTFKERIYNNEIDALLNEVIIQVNDACLRYSSEFGGKTGTTLSLLLTVDDKYYIKNMGDSRIYKKTFFGLKQMTRDQTVINDLLRSGKLTRRQAKHYPKKNMLTMCIGYYKRVYSYSLHGLLKKNDLFVLCSDGLYNYADFRKVNGSVKRDKTEFAHRAEELRNCIPTGKAKDNVSCIVVRYV